jgi:pimeloyl-ACP methyl ester carboxylesterase
VRTSSRDSPYRSPSARPASKSPACTATASAPRWVFLHGFGSTKEDYADVVQQEQLADRPVLAYDAPGCGATTCPDLTALSIPFLVAVAEQVLRAQRIERYHLGHSMGGLTALMLADRDPTAVAGMVNIEGNVAPEDCILSRQIVSHPHDDPREFLADFADRVSGSRYYSSNLFAASLPQRSGRTP